MVTQRHIPAHPHTRTTHAHKTNTRTRTHMHCAVPCSNADAISSPRASWECCIVFDVTSRRPVALRPMSGPVLTLPLPLSCLLFACCSISALQWLFYSVRTDHVARKRLRFFFSCLYRCLRRGARYVQPHDIDDEPSALCRQCAPRTARRTTSHRVAYHDVTAAPRLSARVLTAG